METLFNKRLHVYVKNKDSEDRKANVRVIIELLLTTTPVHKRDLLVRLTDDTDPYFLYRLAISEEDFQSLKVQQGLLVDFVSFPQKFIDLLNHCISEQDSDNPRFLLQLSCLSVMDNSANFNVVETNAFKHLTHLSLRLLNGSDTEIKEYLAVCLSSLKEEKQSLEILLKKTEEDLSRQLNYAQQTLSEKSRELEKLRSEWTSQSTSLSSRHSQDLTAEREKALEIQTKLHQQNEQLRRELEGSHLRSTQELQGKLNELETSNRELTEKKYKSESIIRDLKVKLVGLEEESQRAKQQVLSLRRENSTLDTECHDKERLVNQLQMRIAVMEQEIKDKDQLMLRTKEVLEATQKQKDSMERSAESKEVHVGKLESTVKSLSEEILKANDIIKRLQGDIKGLLAKIKVKNTVTISQERVVQETAEKLLNTQRELHDSQQQLKQRDEEVSKLNEKLEATIQKLDESRDVLKTNENVISWLNKQLNENQLSRKPEPAVGLFESPPVLSSAGGLRMNSATHNMVQFYPRSAKPSMSPIEKMDSTPIVQHPLRPLNKENVEPAGLDSKYFERRDDSIPLRGLLPATTLNLHSKEFPRQPPKQAIPSAYFTG